MLMPNGGVKQPMLRLAVMTMPKCTRSMPAALTIGTRMGVSSRMADAVSMKQPTTSRRTLMISSSTQGGQTRSAKNAVIERPTPLVVNSQENTTAEATMIMNYEVM